MRFAGINSSKNRCPTQFALLAIYQPPLGPAAVLPLHPAARPRPQVLQPPLRPLQPGLRATDVDLQDFCRQLRHLQAGRCELLRHEGRAAGLLDDNNRKPVCRLHFNRAQKYLGILDADKKEVRHPISSLDDIYGFSEQLLAATKLVA